MLAGFMVATFREKPRVRELENDQQKSGINYKNQEKSEKIRDFKWSWKHQQKQLFNGSLSGTTR